MHPATLPGSPRGHVSCFPAALTSFTCVCRTKGAQASITAGPETPWVPSQPMSMQTPSHSLPPPIFARISPAPFSGWFSMLKRIPCSRQRAVAFSGVFSRRPPSTCGMPSHWQIRSVSGRRPPA